MRDGLRVLVAGATGGLLGGGVAGVIEGIYLLATAPQLSGYQVLPYAAVLYGLAGLAIGVVAAGALELPAAIAHRPMRASQGWALGAVVALCALALLVVVTVLRRDVYVGEPLPSPTVAGVAGGGVVGGLLLLMVLAGLAERTMLRVLATPAGGLTVYAVIVVFLGLLEVGSGHMAAELPGRAIPPALAARPNVLLVAVDTLRADHLGCYGDARELTPALDRFAGRAVVYEQAVTQAPGTRASMASLLTSSFPSTHGAVRPGERLRDELETVAEVLSAGGYTTAARVNAAEVGERYGFQQGFDDFVHLWPAHPYWASETSHLLVLYTLLHERVGERLAAGRRNVDAYYRDAAAVTDAGIGFMRDHVGERFFLLLHYRDPHEPYFRHPYDGYAVARVTDPDPPADRAAELAALYRGEVAYVDGELDRLLDYMGEEGLLDETLVVVVADHGEELYEHGGWWHGTTLYDEVVRVPLLVKYPDGFRFVGGHALVDGEPPAPVEVGNGDRVGGQVRVIDVAPTIAQLAGLDAPAGWQGVSLAAPWDEREPMDRLAYAEADADGAPLAALRTARWKLIEAPADTAGGEPACALFDLVADPGEQLDRCGDPDAAGPREALSGRLRAVAVTTGAPPLARGEARMDPETCRQLQALEYVDAEVDCDAL